MTTIGFLACETTLPLPWGGIGDRRGDAFEHDLMTAALEPAFAQANLTLKVIDWEAPLDHFAGLDLIILGTAWNYQDKPDAFLAKIGELEARGIPVCNSAEVVRWNINKTYLRELAKRGAATIPTRWFSNVSQADLIDAFAAFDCDRLVVKLQVGAGALGQVLIHSEALPGADWRFGHAAMVQPFLPAIAEEGEFSFIFIGGELSHALRKRPAKGDYRIQSLYGGIESAYDPTTEELAAASAIIAAFPFAAPLYARIDMLRGSSNSLMVMEAELIEPYLYPEQGPQLGDRLACAILKRLEL
ncbi:ATP-grasp domain-containing protein [Qipengyuania sp. ASV99]|uniref:ATP-grasp domain-containing protein n=1 Tax=Qipengyuania sp. ASV99 TaxID=3399681 RepID=UPI003A4C540F